MFDGVSLPLASFSRGKTCVIHTRAHLISQPRESGKRHLAGDFSQLAREHKLAAKLVISCGGI
jgi:hypothetical protein